MKKIFICSFLILILSTNALAVTNMELTDISNHWAENEINMLLEESIIQGYSDGTFRPNNYITVSEFLKMIVEIADYKLVTIGERWPNWYIQTAIKNNLIEENIFKDYSQPITRGEASKIIGKYIKLDDVNKNKNVFTDLKSEEKDTILKLVKLKVISGYSDNTFRSDNFITRAETCKLLLNAYNAKQELLKTREGELISELTNIKSDSRQDVVNDIRNEYEIKNNRIYIYDSGRYANLNGQTLNQEYIDDKAIINVIKTLVGDESYTELKFVLDKYIINSLNICYGRKQSSVTNGEYIFEIRFYENSYYNVSKSKDEENFMTDAVIRIKIGKMWDKQFEAKNEASSSVKNLFKLQEAIGAILGDEIKDEFIEYIIAKGNEAKNISNSDLPKIVEVKKIGKYTINTFCMNDNDLEIYIKKF